MRRGLCHKHYQAARTHGTLPPPLREQANSIGPNRATWDAHAHAADYRCRMVAAGARIRQALIALDAPGVGSPHDLLADALAELDP